MIAERPLSHEWLTTREAAEILGTRYSYVWRLIQIGALPKPPHQLDGRTYLHSRTVIEAYKAAHPTCGASRLQPGSATTDAS